MFVMFFRMRMMQKKTNSELSIMALSKFTLYFPGRDHSKVT